MKARRSNNNKNYYYYALGSVAFSGHRSRLRARLLSHVCQRIRLILVYYYVLFRCPEETGRLPARSVGHRSGPGPDQRATVRAGRWIRKLSAEDRRLRLEDVQTGTYRARRRSRTVFLAEKVDL